MDDTNDTFYYNETLKAKLDSQENIDVLVWTLIDGVLFFIIIGGNLLTITTILRSRRGPSNLFVLSLACSDFSVGMMLPYHMAFYLEPALNLNFGHCIVRLALVSLACIASMFNISAIAIDRWLAIVFPLHYHKYMTVRVAKTIITLSWLSAFAVASVPVYWHRWPNKCELGLVVQPLYILVIHLPAFLLLFLTMCGFYARILCIARRQVKQMRLSTGQKQDTPGTWKSMQVLLLVMGSFTISYAPFLIVMILNALEYESVTSSTVYKIMNSLAMANSGINPIIYTWKNKEFKDAMIRLIRGSCNWCLIFSNKEKLTIAQPPQIESSSI